MAANYTFVDDVTIPDDMEIAVGTPFYKTWRIRNTGDVDWTPDFTIRFTGGSQMTDRTQYPLPICPAGDEVNITIKMAAPDTPGTHYCNWHLYTPDGERFGDGVYARILGRHLPVIGSGSPDIAFVTDITIPDGTTFTAGTPFTKTWRIRNTGNVPLDNTYWLVFAGGTQMTDKRVIPLPHIDVGKTTDISAPLVAPEAPGTHTTQWRFQNPQQEFFGPPLFVEIDVSAPFNTARNDSAFISDETLPDDTEVAPRQQMVKTWRVQNTGETTWDERYTLRFVAGNAMGSEISVPLPRCAPGEAVNISINQTMPGFSGTHYGKWQMHSPEGFPFGEMLWIQVVVPAADGADVIEPDPVQPQPRDLPRVEIAVVGYSQRDPQWRNVRLGHSGSPHTIGTWGCLMVCKAMYANWRGYTVTPHQFMNLMLERNGFLDGYLTRWEALQNVYSDIRYERKLESGADFVTAINAKLDQGVPVIVQVDLTPDTRFGSLDTHWVLVVGRNGNNDYWVHDPYPVESTPTSLMERYGRRNNQLQSSIVSALLYH
jgi:hypothetical protein